MSSPRQKFWRVMSHLEMVVLMFLMMVYGVMTVSALVKHDHVAMPSNLGVLLGSYALFEIRRARER